MKLFCIDGGRAASAVLCAMILLPLAACGGKKEAETAPVVTVDVAPVLLSNINRTIRSEGVLYPKQQAAIVPKVAAPIRKAFVQRGTKVRAGQLLLELENRDLAGAAAESRATFSQAEATYETTEKGTIPQEVQKAQLDARAAKDAMNAAQAVFENRQVLFKEGAVSEKDVNDARATASQARAQSETAQKKLDDLQAFAREDELKAARAQRDAAKGHSETADAQLGYSRITSPIDGVVTDMPLYAGETPQSGAPIVTVMDLSEVIARTHVSQAEAAELKVGNEADVIGPNGAPIPAKITLVSPALDPASTTVEVWVQVDNRDGKLRPGTSLKVEMIARTVSSALVIPQAAVLTSPLGSTYAIVIDKDDKPHLRKIAVGVRDGGKAEITDGLESGQRVATTGAYELFKLDPEVLQKTKVKIAPAKENEEPEES